MVEESEVKNIVAEALYLQALAKAIESINSLEVRFDELPEIFSRLTDESLTAQVLIYSSYLEDKMFELISLRLFFLDSKSDERRMFSGSGPFSSFESRIFLSYHLGWLNSAQKNKLNAFRKMRNEFAHNAFRTNFDDPKIQSFLKTMDYDLDEFLNPIRSSLIENGIAPLLEKDAISIEKEFLANLSILAHRTFLDYLVLPSAMAHKVSPNDIMKSGFDSMPEPCRDINLRLSDVLLKLLGSEDIAS
ncbi:hypothetical protein NBZ79_17770 [Sneathiella marina]|uniref:Uncharacterized protein n=1 Tax=Sneathiella marina TaxID=2950108 RepID=A0ABY4W1Q5_9PROT|nr:hypothetical protein [Sneathiella marina]USG61008.1 hypothetical protein NBZ79_17770 [Sneathiella marina]